MNEGKVWSHQSMVFMNCPDLQISADTGLQNSDVHRGLTSAYFQGVLWPCHPHSVKNHTHTQKTPHNSYKYAQQIVHMLKITQ